MKLTDKIKLLRQLEGNLRGLGRELTKSEVARLIREERGNSISEAYLSQLESGKRPHMTSRTRELLADFFKVHPGYLVDDPEGFGTELTTVMTEEVDLDAWLRSGALSTANDPQLSQALSQLAEHERSRELIILMAQLAKDPEVLLRLRSTIERALAAVGRGQTESGKEKAM
jgi:transcriptional regulator with XRE-family HTH domain